MESGLRLVTNDKSSISLDKARFLFKGIQNHKKARPVNLMWIESYLKKGEGENALRVAVTEALHCNEENLDHQKIADILIAAILIAAMCPHQHQ